MPKAGQAKSPVPALDPRKVQIALVLRGWTQATLANHIGKSLTTTNLAINHNTFPEVTKTIRLTLGL